MDIKDLLKPAGYIVWIDKLGKWHSSEEHVRLDDSLVSWLLSDKAKRPWQQEPQNFATDCWVIPVAERHRALNIAKKDYKHKVSLTLPSPSEHNPRDQSLRLLF